MLIEAYWERVHREDKQLAHYTAVQLSAHVPKKQRPSAERLRFYQPEKQGGAEVTDIQRKREQKQIREIMRQRNRRTG